MLNIIDANGNKVGIFDGGIAYMDDGTYGECTQAWLDENGYEVVEYNMLNELDLSNLKVSQSTIDDVKLVLKRIQYHCENGLGYRDDCYPKIYWSTTQVSFKNRTSNAIINKIGLDKLNKIVKEEYGEHMELVEWRWQNGEKVHILLKDNDIYNEYDRKGKEAIKLSELFDKDNSEHMRAIIELFDIVWNPKKGNEFLAIWNKVEEFGKATQDESVIARALNYWCSWNLDALKKYGYVW